MAGPNKAKNRVGRGSLRSTVERSSSQRATLRRRSTIDSIRAGKLYQRLTRASFPPRVYEFEKGNPLAYCQRAIYRHHGRDKEAPCFSIAESAWLRASGQPKFLSRIKESMRPIASSSGCFRSCRNRLTISPSVSLITSNRSRSLAELRQRTAESLDPGIVGRSIETIFRASLTLAP